MRNLTTHYKAIRKPHELKRKRVVKKSTRVRRTNAEIDNDSIMETKAEKKRVKDTTPVPDSAANNDVRPFQMRTIKTIWEM